MNFFEGDIDQLVQETMHLVHNFHGKSPFDNSSDELDQNFTDSDSWLVPEACGVLYKVRKGISTFVLNILPSHNLSADYAKFANGEQEGVYFLETEYYELAEIIRDQVANKRFPVNEDTFCNIGDPGFSWWLKATADELDIFFKNSFFAGSEDLVKLGPIGEPTIARVCFNQSADFLSKILPIVAFSCDEKRLKLQISEKNNPVFENLKYALINGDLNYLKAVGIERHGPQLSFFYNELVVVRKFWIKVENIIKNCKPNI